MFIRTCEICGDKKEVNRKSSATKRFCKDCKYLSKERSKKISTAKTAENHHLYGKTLSAEHKEKISKGNKGKVVPLEVRKKMSQSSMGKRGTRKGVKLSMETRRKMRIANQEARKGKLGYYPPVNVNTEACKLFDLLESRFGWDGQHGMKRGEFHIKELGYWLDYYEPTLNLVIEYDERHHIRRKEADKIRQEEIEHFLKCKFIRISEYDTIEEVIESVSKYFYRFNVRRTNSLYLG